MKYVVINRDCDQQRYSEFVYANQHVADIRRFSAIDGQSLDREELIDTQIIERHADYTKGALGSAMSHILLWKAVSDHDEPAVIFEDDAILCRNFVEASNEIISSLPEDWDIILWGNNYDTTLTFNLLPGITHSVARFDQAALRQGADQFPKMEMKSLPFPLIQTLGICGYALSPKGARTLINRCLPIRQCSFYHVGLDRILSNTSIDHVMADHYIRMSAFVSFPPLCITKNEHAKSTIITQ